MPAITKPSNHFNATLYTGDGTSNRTITGTGFQPDWLWLKMRNDVDDNVLVDSVRGGSKRIKSNTTDAESDISYPTLASDGFVVSSGVYNNSAKTFVAWQCKAGGTAVTNTSGTISSQVSANPTAGFSVVTFTAPSSGNFSAGHGLGVTPGMVITKVRGRVTSWITWHNQLNSGSPGTTYYIDLNSTGAQTSFASVWGSTGVTSSVIGMGVGASCAASDTIVAYCFAAVAGYSAFGSYTGNGSANGPFVYLGFRPRWVMFKNTTTGAGWLIFDSSRNTYNLTDLLLQANQTNAEAGNSTDNPLDFLSNGFKLRYSNSATNASAEVYIYMAFAEAPFKYAGAR